jgi:tetratricopeptide (TPR) repeat protein
MKTRSLFLGLLASALVSLSPFISRTAAEPADANTNATPANEPAIVTVTNVVNTVEVEELRTKLDALQRANDLALGRWSALLDQNNSLSNVLTDLRQTLVNERQREIQVNEQARAFNMRVMVGAAAAMFLVFLASYWFQLRCLNRVMEISTAPRELPAPYAPALLEAANARESQLLEAVKLLENRIRQLEAPISGQVAPIAPVAVVASAPAPAPIPQVHTNGSSTENGHAAASEPKIVESAQVDAPAGLSKVSVLLAKGEVLLETERLQEAVNSFNEALVIDANNAEAHLKKGIALERMNRLEQSLSSYNEALRLNPKRSFAYVHKARVLAALHRYDEALSVYDMALGKAPQKATTTTSSSSGTEMHRANAGG